MVASTKALPLAERGFERDFEPTGDFVLMRIHPQNATAGGLHLPEGSHPEPRKATILKVGPGVLRDDGTREPMDVAKGEVVYPVLQSVRAPIQMKVGDTEYIVCAAHAIVGKSKSGTPAKEGE